MNRYDKLSLVAFFALAIAATSAFALVGHAPGVSMAPEHFSMLAPLAAGGFFIGDIADIQKLIEKMGAGWEEYKKTNDELVKAKAEGKDVSAIDEKLIKISSDLDQLGQAKSAIEGTLAAIQKAQLSGAIVDGKGTFAEELKAFNISLGAYDYSAKIAPLTDSQYVEYKGAFFKACREGVEKLNPDERKALIAGDSSQGGYLLPASTQGRVVSKIFELSPVRAIATVQPISTSALEGVEDNDEASSGWVGEVSARPDTNTPTVGKYRIEAFELYANPKATQSLLDDAAVDVETWLANKVASRFARREAFSFINGDGVIQPRGFTTYTLAATPDATRAWGTIEITKTGVNGDFAASTPADILFTLTGAFKSAYLQNAQWGYTREVLTKIRKFKESTTNAYIWQPGLAKGVPDTLLGYPMVNMQDLPALTSNTASLWLADWKEFYTIVDRMGIRTLRDPYTDKPYVHFYSTKRVGGGVLNFEAGKAIQFST